MRKHALSAAIASATLATAVSLSNHAEAMTISAEVATLSAAGTIQLEQVGWCGPRGCRGRYYSRPYPYDWSYYRPWPYYGYFLGSGWPYYGWYR
jgi:hypothetical protein